MQFPQVEPDATMPPASIVEALSSVSSRFEIMSWATCRVDSEQLNVLRRLREAFLPQYCFVPLFMLLSHRILFCDEHG